MKRIMRVILIMVSAAALISLAMPDAHAQAPIITAFAPTSGPVGTTVTIVGTNFVGATSVTFNGTVAPFTVISATQITTTVPGGATTGFIAVTAPSGTASSVTSFTVLVVGPPTPGGSPIEVFTQTFEGDGCADTTLNQEGQPIFDQGFTLGAESNVTVYFSFELGLENPRQEGLISFGLDGIGTDQEWGVAAPGSTTAKFFGVRQSTTLMWTFNHVDPGEHSVQAFARVSTGTAGMNGCALTVFVMPVAD